MWGENKNFKNWIAVRTDGGWDRGLFFKLSLNYPPEVKNFILPF